MRDIPKEMHKILKFEHILLHYINYIKKTLNAVSFITYDSFTKIW